MSSHVWKLVYQTLRRLNRRIPKEGRACQYSDSLIVAMYLWAAFHDRPMCWAADRSNYASVFRPRRLPSRSQFCRRIQSARCQALLDALNRELAGVEDVPNIFLMDSRPLCVGAYSRDPDVRTGYTRDGFKKGYKLHALATKQGGIAAWRLTPLNRNDKPIARELIEEARPQGMVLADGAYDSGALYDHVFKNGALLFTPLPANVGGGHRPQSAARLMAADLSKNNAAFLSRERLEIERIFSRQSSFGGGLAPLPAWVRRWERVNRWVTAKLILYHARLLLRSKAA
jgi:hypothetical protein